jgi:glycosyltransferase involved in cell wall biosynthesis
LKNNHFSNMQVVFAGPVIDERTYQEVKSFVAQNSWAHYIGEIPLEEITQVCEWADYVLNTSISEGQSSALLEAMYMGKVVIARRNAGNESIINNMVNGILYDNQKDFIKALLFIEENSNICDELKKRARNDVQARFNLKSEMAAYIRLYKKYIGKGRAKNV